MRRFTALSVALLASATLLTGLGSAPTTAQAKTTKPTPISVTPATPTQGQPFTIRGKIGTKVKRPVTAQYKSGSSWKTLVSGKTTSKGAYTLTATTSAASLVVRVVAKKVKIKHKTYKKVTTKTRTITTTAPPPVVTGSAPVITTTSLPLTSVGLNYSVALEATGTGPITWTATGLPPGISITSDGHITGNARSETATAVRVTATSAAGAASKTLVLLTLPPAGLIAAGATFSCTITQNGALKCWGDNAVGQLGNGTTTASTTPVDVHGLGSGVVAVSAGQYHACALKGTGAVFCWGDNIAGQLGNGNLGAGTGSSLPTAVIGLGSGVVSLTSGSYHNCAVRESNPETASGDLYCWGSDVSGQLGDQGTAPRSTPAVVTGLTDVIAAAAGAGHTCALSLTHAVKCWGWNGEGEIGDGTLTNRPTPTDVEGTGGSAAQVAAGAQESCAILTAGQAVCWGNNQHGELGTSVTGAHPNFTTVSGLSSGAYQLAVGGHHVCAVTGAGAALCWGNGVFGELGNNQLTDQSSAQQVVGLTSNTLAIASGAFHSCAITKGLNDVVCWGSNAAGQLGQATGAVQSTPVGVVGLS